MTSVVVESNRNMNGEKLLICIKQCIMEHFQPMIYVENRNVIQTTRGTFSVPDNYRNHKILSIYFYWAHTVYRGHTSD